MQRIHRGHNKIRWTKSKQRDNESLVQKPDSDAMLEHLIRIPNPIGSESRGKQRIYLEITMISRGRTKTTKKSVKGVLPINLRKRSFDTMFKAFN